MAGTLDGQIYMVSIATANGGATIVARFHELLNGGAGPDSLNRSAISWPAAGQRLGTTTHWGVNGHRIDNHGMLVMDRTSSPQRGTLYFASNRNPNPSDPTLDQGDIYLSVSVNGASSWTTGRIPTASGRTQFFPMVDIDDQGWVHVAYYENGLGLENAGVLNAGTAGVYYTVSKDNGQTWSPPVQVNEQQNTLALEDPPTELAAFDYYLIGDYHQMRAIGTGSNTTAFILWTNYDKYRADDGVGTKKERVYATVAIGSAVPGTTPMQAGALALVLGLRRHRGTRPETPSGGEGPGRGSLKTRVAPAASRGRDRKESRLDDPSRYAARRIASGGVSFFSRCHACVPRTPAINASVKMIGTIGRPIFPAAMYPNTRSATYDETGPRRDARVLGQEECDHAEQRRIHERPAADLERRADDLDARDREHREHRGEGAAQDHHVERLLGRPLGVFECLDRGPEEVAALRGRLLRVCGHCGLLRCSRHAVTPIVPESTDVGRGPLEHVVSGPSWRDPFERYRHRGPCDRVKLPRPRQGGPHEDLDRNRQLFVLARSDPVRDSVLVATGDDGPRRLGRACACDGVRGNVRSERGDGDRDPRGATQGEPGARVGGRTGAARRRHHQRGLVCSTEIRAKRSSTPRRTRVST